MLSQYNGALWPQLSQHNHRRPRPGTLPVASVPLLKSTVESMKVEPVRGHAMPSLCGEGVSVLCPTLKYLIERRHGGPGIPQRCGHSGCGSSGGSSHWLHRRSGCLTVAVGPTPVAHTSYSVEVALLLLFSAAVVVVVVVFVGAPRLPIDDGY